MAINSNFYATTNELLARSTKGLITNVVDYSTFIDAGKKLSTMTDGDWKNAFMNELVNKVKLTIEMFRTYNGSLADMMGQSTDGAIELIMHQFYSARESMFDSSHLIDNTSVDPFVINKPKIEAAYYVSMFDETFLITRSDDDLDMAIKSPEALDSFYRTIFGDVTNSIELHRENQRLATLCNLMSDDIKSGIEEDSVDTASSCYDLRKIYNKQKNTSLSIEEFLYNADAIAWACSQIRRIRQLMEKPNTNYNPASASGEDEFVTFTPQSAQSLKLNSKFESAYRAMAVTAFNPEYATVGEYEAIPYWQTSKNLLKFTMYNNSNELGPVVLGCVYDNEYAIKEHPVFISAEAIRNPRGRYTNTWWNVRDRFVKNTRANSVTFILGEDEEDEIVES